MYGDGRCGAPFPSQRKERFPMATSPPLASWRELAADLEAERRRLAFDAERGDEEAARKLEVIEADLAEVRLQIERGEAAQLEAEHRTQIEKAERAAAERSRMERELRRLATQRLKLAKQIDAALDALVGASREVLDLASKMEDLDKALGGPGTNFRAWRALPD